MTLMATRTSLRSKGKLSCFGHRDAVVAQPNHERPDAREQSCQLEVRLALRPLRSTQGLSSY
jgi:hypothetical protein